MIAARQPYAFMGYPSGPHGYPQTTPAHHTQGVLCTGSRI